MSNLGLASAATSEPVASGQGEPLRIEEVQRQLAGTGLRYDDPFGPACDPEEWNAVRSESLDSVESSE